MYGEDIPPSGFDCSGFVSYVVNHCGNGWNYGRLSAEGLRGQCAVVPPSEARPGDLIFFQGTYSTPGCIPCRNLCGERNDDPLRGSGPICQCQQQLLAATFP